jgi:anti-sigma28 factor (negative regulator of flagellin synthesis)
MRIDNVNANGVSGSTLDKARGAEAGSGAAGSTGTALQAGGDHVLLSDLASQLAELASSETPQGAARLEQLAAQFRAGQYQPDPMAVSRKLVGESLAPGV